MSDYLRAIGISDPSPRIAVDRAAPSLSEALVEAGMVICVESFTGSDRGGEGVKLEDCALVTETGHRLLSSYPSEAELLEAS